MFGFSGCAVVAFLRLRMQDLEDFPPQAAGRRRRGGPPTLAAGVNGEGPQLTQAVAGAPLLLRTRVYNDSLVDMPAGSSIVVQFYGQPWNPTLLVPRATRS